MVNVAQVVEDRVGGALLPPVAKLAALRVRTVARLLGIRRQEVYRLCKLRVFRGAYIDGERGWRIPAGDVEAYQEQRRQATERVLRAVRM